MNEPTISGGKDSAATRIVNPSPGQVWTPSRGVWTSRRRITKVASGYVYFAWPPNRDARRRLTIDEWHEWVRKAGATVA